MRRFASLAIVSIAFAGLVSRADAAAITYSSAALWGAAVGSFNTETFNGFASDASFQNSSIALAGGMSVTGTVGSNGAATQKIDASPFEFGGFYQTDNTAYLLGDIAGGAQFLRFNFAAPLSAWGIDTVGIADGGRPTTISIFDASNALLGTIALASDASAQQKQFYGFQLTGGQQAAYLTFVNSSGSNDAFGIDNVRFVPAAAVPEPATLLLLGTGLLAAGARRRRNRAPRA